MGKTDLIRHTARIQFHHFSEVTPVHRLLQYSKNNAFLVGDRLLYLATLEAI